LKTAFAPKGYGTLQSNTSANKDLSKKYCKTTMKICNNSSKIIKILQEKQVDFRAKKTINLYRSIS